MRSLTPPANIDTSIDDFLDDQEYDGDTSKSLAEPPRAQPPTVLNTALQCSQRTIGIPVRYADKFSELSSSMHTPHNLSLCLIRAL